MKILYYTNGQIKRYPEGYEIDGIFQPMGELQTGVHHLEMVTTEQPTFDNVTQYITSEFLPDFDDNEYRQVWCVHDRTDYEIAMQDWDHPEYAMRIKVPFASINSNEQLQGFVSQLVLWWNLTKLIHEIDIENSYFYCNFIHPEHEAIVNAFEQLIEIENKPTE